MNERRNDLEIMNWIPQIALQIQTRIDLLFTMSEIPQARPVRDNACEVMFRGRLFEALYSKHCIDLRFHLVEPDGIEPTTSCLQSTRSPS
jgi:hypothetical protein